MGRYSGKKCRLLSMIFMVGFFIPVEMIIGYVTNSTALIADSLHMFSDAFSLIIAYVSVHLSSKKYSKNTYGWARAEVVGAMINAVFLFAICFNIAIEAFKRIIKVEEIHNAPLLIVIGAVGFLFNLIGLLLFHEHGHSHGNRRHVADIVDNESSSEEASNSVLQSFHHNHSSQNHHSSHMNIRGVFLHVLTDALGSIIVIISASIMWYYPEWEYRFYVDPALSLIMVSLILCTTWPLLKESGLILLQSVPTHIQVEAIKDGLLKTIDGILEVKDLHIWQLDGDIVVASAHIKYRNYSDYSKVSEKVKQYFHNEGIHKLTLEPEIIDLHSASFHV